MAHRHMDDVAHGYERTIPPHVTEHYLRKRVDFIRRRLPGGLIADVGCGTGLLASRLRDAGYRVVGVDESFGMLQECRGTHAVPCAHGDSAHLPLQTGAVDAAICVATMHHVVSREAVARTLREMLRIVKPGGFALIWDHNPLNPYWPLFMKRLPQDQEETRLVPMGEFVSVLSAAGAASIEARRLGLVPDFTPPGLLWLFRALEGLAECVPGVRSFCAHNVVVAVKGR